MFCGPCMRREAGVQIDDHKERRGYIDILLWLFLKYDKNKIMHFYLIVLNVFFSNKMSCIYL